MNKIALITGASGGIGKEISSNFANNNYSVILMYHSNKDALTELVKSFPSSCHYLLIGCDLTDNSAVQKAVKTIHDQFGKVSVLVNNAGIAYPQMLFTDSTEEQMTHIFQSNVFSQLRLSRLLLDDLRFNKGSIINISSIWGLSGASCEVLYSATKAAIIGFTKALAKEMGPSQVRVNCVAPGYIDTNMNSGISPDAKESFRQSTPLMKIGSPREIAEAVFFLSQSDFITGQVLSVDGGVNI